MEKRSYFHFLGHGAVHWRQACPGALQAQTEEHQLPLWPHDPTCGCGTPLERECLKCVVQDGPERIGD
jgi:hypothetical protein